MKAPPPNNTPSMRGPSAATAAATAAARGLTTTKSREQRYVYLRTQHMYADDAVVHCLICWDLWKRWPVPMRRRLDAAEQT